MVEFLYRGDYKELEPSDYQPTDETSLDSDLGGYAILHAAMFAVADKYNIATLGDVAKNKFKEAINETVLDTRYFMNVIEDVYSTTPESNRGLRDLIVLQTQTRGAKIMADPELNSRLEEIISTTPHFAMDLIQNSLLPASSSSSKRCPTCNVNMGDGIICSGCARNDVAQRGWLFNQSRNLNVDQRGGGGLFGNTNAYTHPNTGGVTNTIPTLILTPAFSEAPMRISILAPAVFPETSIERLKLSQALAESLTETPILPAAPKPSSEPTTPISAGYEVIVP